MRENRIGELISVLSGKCVAWVSVHSEVRVHVDQPRSNEPVLSVYDDCIWRNGHILANLDDLASRKGYLSSKEGQSLSVPYPGVDDDV